MQNEFQAYVNDEESYATAMAWAEGQGFGSACVQQAPLDIVIQSMGSDNAPHFLLVDVDGVPDAAASISRIVGLSGGGTKVVALGTLNDIDVYRKFISVGVSDYLVKPLLPEALTQIIAKVLRGDTESGFGARDAKIVVFIGTRGGVGTSTIALNTAWISAHEARKQTAFLDLDLHFGSSALALDLDPGRGLRDLVSSPQRVDNLMIASTIVAESDTLSVLCAEEGIDDIIPVDGNAITTLLKEMRPNYGLIFVDLPRHSIPIQKRLLAAAHEIVLVSEMSLVGIRDTLRIRTVLKSLACPARLTIIVSPVGPQRPSQIDKSTFENGIQTKIDFIIPDDAKTAADANNNGKSFAAVAPGAAVTKKMRDLLLHLDSENVQDTGKGGWLSQFIMKKKKK